MTQEVGLIIGSIHPGMAFNVGSKSSLKTPFGLPSSPVLSVSFGSNRVACIARHGEDSNIPPHAVNYRANLWALHQHGVRQCVALNAVGTLDSGFPPGELAVPDQLIDYTWDRKQTFRDSDTDELVHLDFTEPFDIILKERIAAAIKAAGFSIRSGVYGVTQGPRLETVAEINRLERDGCTMVGMTAMPEAVLARELGMPYAICALAVNYAAGRGDEGLDIHSQMERYITEGLGRLSAVLDRLVPDLCASV